MSADRLLFINGQYVPAASGRTFDNINPATGQRLGAVSEADADDVDRAVTAAKRALSGPWGTMSAQARGTILRRVADEIDKRHDAFLRAEIEDTGKPVSLAQVVDIPRGAANFRSFADVFASMPTETFEMPTPGGGSALNYVVRDPVGVVGVICPWNLPLLLMTWKVAPALAAGNTVVVKPSEETPSTATLLGEAMKAAGVPDGVYNVVHGFGPNAAGQALVKHPDVNAVTFTGESATGQAIMKDAADLVKPVSMELGGKNAGLVFADADFDAAVAGTLRSVFLNSGQVCLCTERLLVERPIYERFVEAIAQGARDIVAGDPWSEKTTMGPLISSVHRDKVQSYFTLAEQEGAEVHCGGGAADIGGAFAEGYYVQPTVWTGLSDDARCVREEVFGPVCHIAPFDDDDEAVARANDTEYGLCASVWTQNVTRAHRVSRRLDVGITWVNAWYLRDLRTPFGGAKMSGLGREGGAYSLDFYTEMRNICIAL